MQTGAMKACFQIAECSFAFAKILQKSEIAKRFATFFYIIPHFFLRNQNIHLKIFEVSIIICIFAPLVPAKPLNKA
jgi:hypothetical protein